MTEIAAAASTRSRWIWMEAARPRTLTAALSPVVVGTAAADHLIAWRAVAALVVALAIQVAVNYANDYFDARKGVDTRARIGPRRATAGGLVSAAEMKAAIAVALGIAIVAGTALAVAVGPELFVVGALSVAAALGYSGGPRPYGSRALGEVSVFLFFGVIATAGSAYVQIDEVTGRALIASVPVGLLAAAILVVNNLRDIDTDRDAGKVTLAVRLGRYRTRLLFRALVVASFVAVFGIAAVDGSAWPLLALAALPAARAPISLVAERDDPRALVRALAATARLELLYSVPLGIGLWIS